MPGQNGEDKIIYDYVSGLEGVDTRFLDVGAFHPTTFSNTRILVENGWSGVFVEPAPSNFTGFLNEYRLREDLVLVNAAIARESALVNFYDSEGDALSSLKKEHADFYNKAYGTRFRGYLTKTITWDELLDAVEAATKPISVLSLDVESLNVELFNLLPIKRLPKLRVLCVEHDGQHEMMVAKMLPYGFTSIHFNGENLILAR